MLGIALALMLQAPPSTPVAMDGAILYRIDATSVMVHSGKFNPDVPGFENPGTHWVLMNSTWYGGDQLATPPIPADPTPWGSGFIIVNEIGSLLPYHYRVYQ